MIQALSSSPSKYLKLYYQIPIHLFCNLIKINSTWINNILNLINQSLVESLRSLTFQDLSYLIPSWNMIKVSILMNQFCKCSFSNLISLKLKLKLKIVPQVLQITLKTFISRLTKKDCKFILWNVKYFVKIL
jgi:hypothetical protein